MLVGLVVAKQNQLLLALAESLLVCPLHQQAGAGAVLGTPVPFTSVQPTHHRPSLVVKASRSAQPLHLKPFPQEKGKAQSEGPCSPVHLVWPGI